MDKWVLITGASSGIGSEIARYLDTLGYHLILCARREDRLKDIVSSFNEQSLVMPVDLCDLLQIRDVFVEINKHKIKLTGMVHCAGIGHTLAIRNNDVDYMRKLMEVHYFAFVELGKYFSKKKYSNDDASIVAISSISSLTCYTGACNYAASKAAVNAAVKVMSKEFMRRRIRVNAILPAYVNTPMGPSADDEDYIKQQPLGIIQPKYVAYLAEFLLSGQSKYMTGALVPMSGGMSY